MTTITDHVAACEFADCGCETACDCETCCDCHLCEFCDEWTADGLTEMGRHAGSMRYLSVCKVCENSIERP